MHDGTYENVRKASKQLAKPVAIMADLQGPKIRLGRFVDGPHELFVGDIFTITTEDVPGTKEICSTTLKSLTDDVNVGDALLIDDGKVALRAIEVDDVKVVAQVTVGGMVSNNKGINLPGVAVNVPALSERTRTISAGPCAAAWTWLLFPSSGTPRTSSASTKSWTKKAAACR